MTQLNDRVEKNEDRIDSANRDIGKLWKAHGELAVIVHGQQGDNGIRSEVRELEKWRSLQEELNRTMQETFRQYRDVERKESCMGIAALKKYIEECKLKVEEDSKVKVATIQSKGQVTIQIITLVGILFTALISLLK